MVFETRGFALWSASQLPLHFTSCFYVCLCEAAAKPKCICSEMTHLDTVGTKMQEREGICPN